MVSANEVSGKISKKVRDVCLFISRDAFTPKDKQHVTFTLGVHSSPRKKIYQGALIQIHQLLGGKWVVRSRDTESWLKAVPPRKKLPLYSSIARTVSISQLISLPMDHLRTLQCEQYRQFTYSLRFSASFGKLHIIVIGTQELRRKPSVFLNTSDHSHSYIPT